MEHLHPKGLANDAVTTTVMEPLQIPVQGVAGAADDGTAIVQLSDGFGGVRTVHHRHDEVHQDGVICGQAFLLDLVHGDGPVFCFLASMTDRFQCLELQHQ